MLSKIQNYIDKLVPESSNKAPAEPRTIEIATAVLLIEISLADSRIQDAEMQVMEKLVVELFGLDQAGAEKLISTARQEADNAVSLYEFTRLLNDHLSRDERIQIIEHLWRVAIADQVIDKYEEYYVRKIAGLLYVSHSDYIKAKHRAAAAE